MSKIIVVTQPDFDLATRYLSAWAEEIIKLAKTHGNTVIDLKGSRANRAELESIIKKRHPRFIVLNGHGSNDEIAGQDNESLVKKGMNEAIVTNTIVYAISCSSAKLLGVAAIEKGALCYLGYEDDFIFLNDHSKLNKPLQDPLAQLFLEPSNKVSMALIKGHTTGKAYRKSKEMLRQTIRRILTSEASYEEKACLRYLLWNYQHFTCIGSTNAML